MAKSLFIPSEPCYCSALLHPREESHSGAFLSSLSCCIKSCCWRRRHLLFIDRTSKVPPRTSSAPPPTHYPHQSCLPTARLRGSTCRLSQNKPTGIETGRGPLGLETDCLRRGLPPCSQRAPTPSLQTSTLTANDRFRELPYVPFV